MNGILPFSMCFGMVLTKGLSMGRPEREDGVDGQIHRFRLAIVETEDHEREEFYRVHQQMMEGGSSETAPRVAQMIAWLARIGMHSVLEQVREERESPYSTV